MKGNVAMWMRSPGLGKTELSGHFEKLERKEDWLILHMRITDPVKWHVRAAMDFKDVMRCAIIIIKHFFLGSFFFVLFKNTDKRETLEDF